MNIVYALSGEGRGHGSLARAVLPVLQRAGHRLKIVTYGQSLDQLADYDVLPIKGIRHCYDRQGRLSVLKSVVKNVGVLSYYVSDWKAIRGRLRDFSPDLFIVNFEPFTPLIARSLRVPVLSIDNQHALLYLKEPTPKGYGLSAWTTKTAIRLVAPRAEHFLVITFAAIENGWSNLHVVPPVVKEEIRQLRPTIGSKVLVYVKQPNARFLETLKQTDEQFLIYGYDTAATDRNLTFRVFNSRMPAEMGESKAVMGTAGLSLIAEAVWLKKPFFGVPLKNEFEQTVSAMAVKRLNFGDFSENPSKEQIEQFLANLDGYRNSLKAYQFDADAAAKKLLELIAVTSGRNQPATRWFTRDSQRETSRRQLRLPVR
jgi:uncharacterized protein (TIGR00661 family)